MASQLKAKPLFLAFASVVITVTGALLGAQLKTEQQAVKNAKQMREASPSEKIEILEQTKHKILVQKRSLEEKIESLHARQAKHETERLERIERSKKGEKMP
ncbi:uncharacterized protein KY384_006327 [Bacidia gigantensis]|uniref:uncharacterized protein n=1 Tax=Bacidia gigantensis TaxID=2732470 RepID=UPI001D0428C4|nr:uncharacterized protein KY384_006327 [Bacidia gigantensis]KAG8528640.1 hypothetical protein KY384_006327 [Bacidia gigantensis]